MSRQELLEAFPKAVDELTDAHYQAYLIAVNRIDSLCTKSVKIGDVVLTVDDVVDFLRLWTNTATPDRAYAEWVLPYLNRGDNDILFNLEIVVKNAAQMRNFFTGLHVKDRLSLSMHVFRYWLWVAAAAFVYDQTRPVPVAYFKASVIPTKGDERKGDMPAGEVCFGNVGWAPMYLEEVRVLCGQTHVSPALRAFVPKDSDRFRVSSVSSGIDGTRPWEQGRKIAFINVGPDTLKDEQNRIGMGWKDDFENMLSRRKIFLEVTTRSSRMFPFSLICHKVVIPVHIDEHVFQPSTPGQLAPLFLLDPQHPENNSDH